MGEACLAPTRPTRAVSEVTNIAGGRSGWRARPHTSAVRASRVAFVGAGSSSGKFVSARAGVAGDVQTRLVVHPIDQAILKHRIGSGDAVRNGDRVADFARGLGD